MDDKNALVETHVHQIPGNLLGLDDSQSLTLVFAHAPFLTNRETTAMILPYPGAHTCGVIPLSGGQGGLGIIIEQPSVPVDKDKVEELLEFGISQQAAANTIVSAHFGKVAQLVAGMFFNTPDNIDPTLHIRASFNDDVLQVERVRILMAGDPNHHPFWNPA